MDSFYEFVVSVPSDEGNLSYEVFDKDFLTFCRLILRTIPKKITVLNPDVCKHYIEQDRSKLGCNQKLQLIADKILDFSKVALKNGSQIKVVFTMHGL